jgi:hypothetical protein
VVSVAGTEGDSSVSVAWDPPTLAAGITGYETVCPIAEGMCVVV